MNYYNFDGEIINASLYPDYEKTRYLNWKNDCNPPILYERKESCCGCYACYSICAKDAIIMQEDQEGFIYPLVDISKCVFCHKCEKVCPIKNRQLK